VNAADALQKALKSQYHASLAMLREAIECCPDDTWYDSSPANAFWQIAYHSLFFAHLYLQADEAAFVPWPGHRRDSQNPDGIAGPPDAASSLPLIPQPYAKGEVLQYWRYCSERVDAWVDALDLESPECGFNWYPVSKLEHQLVNIRHIQHHAAQLGDRLRRAHDIGVQWVGRGRRDGSMAPS
jgi:hypothetical protein